MQDKTHKRKSLGVKLQLLHKHIFLATTLSSIFLFTACAPESKYNGGNGSLHSYESIDAYGSSAIKYRSDYTEPVQSSFNSTLVANDSDNIRQTPQNNRMTQPRNNYVNRQVKSNSNSEAGTSQSTYESPVQGNGGFTPTQSLLGGMRDSEAIQRATMRPYTVRGKTYRPHPVKVGDTFDGVASWYGPDFHAKSTSNGETYNMYAHTAANKTLPMNTIVKVYNKDNGKTTVVRINDRGPFVEGRIIDLSNIAAHDIAMVGKGVANVRIEVVGFGANMQNNTLPLDSNGGIDSVNKDSNMQAGKSQETSQQYPATKEQAFLKPRPADQQQNLQENTQQYNPAPNNIESTKAYADDATNTISQNKAQEPQMQTNTPQNNQVDGKDINNATSLNATEEELPLFDTSKQQKQPIQAKTQEPEQSNDETIESSFGNATPKRIDNTEALKDIDTAMQKLKDSADDISKKMQEEKAKIANEKKKEAISNQANQEINEPKGQTVEANQTPKDAKIDNITQQKENKEATTNKQNISNFMVSLNVFSSEDRAKHFKDESYKITQNTPYTIDIVPTDKGLYRVALRGFKTHEEAKAFILQHSIKGHVVQEQ